MARRFETGLVALIGVACVAFTAVLVRGPAMQEERTMQGMWRSFLSRWDGDEVRVLGRNQVLRLPAWREGSSVWVQSGTVVVTREGDPEDHVLQAGAELRVPGRGLAVAWALEPSRVEVRRGGARQAGEQATLAHRLSATP